MCTCRNIQIAFESISGKWTLCERDWQLAKIVLQVPLKQIRTNLIIGELLLEYESVSYYDRILIGASIRECRIDAAVL